MAGGPGEAAARGGFAMLIVLLLIMASAVGLVLVRGHGPATHAVFLRRAALTFMCVSSALIGLFVIGETFDNPGGWRAVGLVALWLVPMAALSVLAWFRPGWAVPVLAVLTAGAVALAIWFAIDPAWWRALEGGAGPLRAVGAFALSLPLGLLGWRRAAWGGALLLVLGVVPAAAGAAAMGMASVSLTVVAAPAMLAGVLYAGAEVLARRAGRGAGRGANPSGKVGLAGRG